MSTYPIRTVILFFGSVILYLGIYTMYIICTVHAFSVKKQCGWHMACTEPYKYYIGTILY